MPILTSPTNHLKFADSGGKRNSQSQTGPADSMSASPSRKLLTMRELNPRIIEMQYAVRGPLVIRAAEIEKELKQNVKKPFKSVIRVNIGDAHAMQQHSITFIRQVIAACTYPSLLDSAQFPSDVIERARLLLGDCGGCSVGSYSASVGLRVVREHVSDYIRKRDGGIASDPENIILSNGASEAIRSLMKLFNRPDSGGKPVGVMVSIPQYPLYSATTSEYGIYRIGYYLNEEKNWALDIAELKRALEEARPKCRPALLCVINPGNPTGQVLTRANIEEVVKFAYEEKLFLFADEVYQDNVYDPNSKFHSFKKVMHEMGPPYSHMELASFHSASKGYMGECGLRGGYAEIVNMHPEVLTQFKKSISAKLCSSVLGQIAMDCVVKPPAPGEPSYELFAKVTDSTLLKHHRTKRLQEKAEVLNNLHDKASMISEALNGIKGVKCNKVQGAMYAFPRIFLPPKAIEKAKVAESLGQEPDFFYAMNLLESTGVCVIPGSGFGQKEGTYHFRTTILPPPTVFHDFIERFSKFHERFMTMYS
ncbi:alanine aminotransferase [Trichuris trichiura]|uniref:alanine transaminase n=1 Tax=Trichuris trichiura TaxID=36087 RepID=A0A077ZCV8_TRITR|nr:alanine aminotransferase [Trichuris trichiura]